MMIRIEKYRDRGGMTLVELVVVLVVLIGLAGILVPMLPSMLTRTHTSTASTNISDIARMIGTYEQLNSQFPDGWDSLVTTNGNLASYVANAVDANGNTMITGNLSNLVTVATLTPDEATALTTAGVVTIYNFVDWSAPGTPPGPVDPTFYPYAAAGSATTPIPPANPVLVSSAPKVVKLNALGISKLGLPSNGVYVLFGLGRPNSMTGRTTVDAPVHFSNDANQCPECYYSRFAVVFKVGTTSTAGSTTSSPASPRATLASVCDISCDDGLSGLGDHIQEYYKTVKSGQ